MPSLELRPRLATEIVDASFQLYRHHFRALVTLSLTIFAPLLIVQFALTGGSPPDEDTRGISLILLTVIGWIVGSLSEAAIVVAVSNSYLNGEPDPRASLRRTMRRFGAILLAVMAKWLLIGLTAFLVFFVVLMVAGVVGFAIGGESVFAGGSATMLLTGSAIGVGVIIGLPLAAIVFARYFAASAAVVLEGKGWLAGLKRSAELSKGMKRKVVGALGVPMMMFFVINMVLGFLSSRIPGPALIGFVVMQASSVIVSPILAVIATLLYYDARIRKEGFDIERMAADLGSTDTAAVSSQQSVLPG